MGKSFDNQIDRKWKIRDGQSVWGNFYKRLISYMANINNGDGVRSKVYPYARLISGIDLAKNIDADPLHTSLPSGTYNGIAYTHSDDCLAAKYPEIASSLRPTVEFWVRQQYAVVDQVTVTLIIDAIGAMMVVGTEIYGVALAEARVRSGFKTVDEVDFRLGAFLFGTPGGESQFSDFGILAGVSSNDANQIVTSATFSKTDQISTENTIQTNHNESQSAFDRDINSNLVYCFLTPQIKEICKLMYANIIKFRYADADTSRYLVLYPDNFGGWVRDNYSGAPSYAASVAYIKNLVENHCMVILQRYSFFADMMRSLGFVRLSGARPVDNEASTDRICINTSANNINIVYDEADVIKNIWDHNALKIDELSVNLKDTSNTILDTVRKYILVESDSYLNNQLELGDSILMNDGILSVLLHDGIRLYSAGFIDIYKQSGNSVPQWTYSRTQPKIVRQTSGTNLPGPVEAAISAVNDFFNNTRLLDPTWVPVYTEGSGLFVLEFGDMQCGINTYAAPSDDIYMIESYSVMLICFNSDKIKSNNDTLGKDPSLNNQAK